MILDELLGYAYSSGFKAFSIKSAFEPITPPLKWVLTDAACKVNMIFQYRVDPSWEMHNVVKFLIFIRVFGFSRLRLKSRRCFLIYSANRGDSNSMRETVQFLILAQGAILSWF